MIKIKGNYFLLETQNTAMALRAHEGRVETVYYGEKLPDYTGLDLLGEGGGLFLTGGDDPFAFREPTVHVRCQNGAERTSLRFVKGRIAARTPAAGLPASYGAEKCLKLEFLDETTKLRLILTLTPYDDSDAIAWTSSLVNGGKRPVSVLALASLRLDLSGTDFTFTTFNGTWGRERQRHTRAVACGKAVNETFAGASSPYANPFVLLGREGEVYGVNLVWSGDHRETAEADESCGRTRLNAGINPYAFDWELGAGERFDAPEAVSVFGRTEGEVSRRMHRFVSRHIVRGKWKERERPVLVNNWEGTYFDFDREKLLAIASSAAEAGIELFVLDDGWFGRRDDDTRSLGDWTDYREKTGGLARLAEDVRALGLRFGIWMEPEMISEDSELYQRHPEYAMKIPRREPVRIRNQLMLDLTEPQVQNYILRSVSKVIETTKAQYVKWDYNRHMTDCFGRGVRGGEYRFRYLLGLYAVLSKLTERFPNVLFESCASGGGRFDLGMLCYMPQVWTSDNTDARERIAIQSGTGYGYPPGTIGAHVSASPNHQTGNLTPLDARFHVAIAGVLGYESDLSACSQEEIAIIREQVVFYKKYRTVLQFGDRYRLGDAFSGDYAGFLSVSEDKSRAVAVVAVLHTKVSLAPPRVRFPGLSKAFLYRVSVRAEDGTLHPLGETEGGLLAAGWFPLGTLSDPSHANAVRTKLFVFERIPSRKKRT